MSPKLIIALDFSSKESALKLVDQLDPKDCALKIGSEMFTAYGPEWVRYLLNQSFPVFLDLKFHDIPNTVAHACKVAGELGVWMVNVHASGGVRMMSAAREALETFGKARPLLIAVTVLTSLEREDLLMLNVEKNVSDQVIRLASLAQTSGLDGVVCSGLEVPRVKETCGSSFLTVTPGLRLSQESHDDQRRVVMPEEAVTLGSDYWVIGRPVTQSMEPQATVKRILAQLRT